MALKKRFPIYLGPDLLKEIRILAVKRGISTSELMEQMLTIVMNAEKRVKEKKRESDPNP